MKPGLVNLVGLGATLALGFISVARLSGVRVPYGFELVATVVLLAVLALELRSVWGPAARK